MVNSSSNLVLMEIAIRAPLRYYLGLTFAADRLLAHLALGAAREDAEPRLLAEEAQLQGRVGVRGCVTGARTLCVPWRSRRPP